MNAWSIGFIFAVVSGVLLCQRESVAAERDTGRDLYLKYCSSCHGADAKGNGSVAPVLKIKVPDLTVLTQTNKGVFPYPRVMSSIDGTKRVRGHGEPAMPVWGEVFKEEVKSEPYKELTALLKTKVIADYIATVQR